MQNILDFHSNEVFASITGIHFDERATNARLLADTHTTTRTRHNSTVETTRILSLFTIYVSIRNKILHLRDVCSSHIYFFFFLAFASRFFLVCRVLWILALAWCLYKNYSLISVCLVCIHNRNAAHSYHLTPNCSMSFGCDITFIQKKITSTAIG